MIVIIDAVTTAANSMAKNGQNVTAVYCCGSNIGRKNKYPKLNPAGRNGKVARENQD